MGLLLYVLVALTVLMPPSPAVAQTSGLVGAYSFSEGAGTTAADASGNGNSGVLTNGAVFVAGKNGAGVSFDGVNDFVNLTNAVSLRLTGSMTLSAWIKSSAFPSADAAIVSKRQSSNAGYQLDTTVDTGPRTIGFKISDAAGNPVGRYGATAMLLNTWYHVAGVYNAANRTMTVYLNGQVDNGALIGTIPATQSNSNQSVNLGRRPGVPGTFNFAGVLDDVRIYNRALSQAEIQLDVATPVGGGVPPDTTPPSVALTAPAGSAVVSGTAVTVSATASDDRGVAGVQFLLDGVNLGAEDTTASYSVVWNTTTSASGSHTLTARARDATGNTATSTPVTVVVDNTPPSGTIVINAGAAATNNRTVTLTLSASDASSGVTQMRFSNTGASYSAAQAYATSASWTLTSGAGTKTVYAQFRDGAGNWSAAATDTIVLDTTAPAISGTAAAAITATSATVTWTTSEAATTQVNYGVTTSYGQTTALDSALVTSHSVALTGLAPQTTYNYRVRSRDAAGNEAVGTNFTFTTLAGSDTSPPSAPTGLVATPVSATQITLTWNASTDNVAVTGYRVLRGGAIVTTTVTLTYADSGLTPATLYSYTVVAFDAAGNASAPSAAATATTPPADATAPVVSLTAPAANATVSGVVTVSATASDNTGVVGVQFLLDGAPLGAEDTTSPYSVTWNTGTASNGSHTLSARARDAAGNVGTAPPVNVTVANSVSSGLAAGWNFNEGAGSLAQDVSGNNNTASVPSASAWTVGHSGGGIAFSGNTFLSVPNSLSLDISGSALTVSLWIQPQAPAGGDTVLIGKFWNPSMTSPYYQYGIELDGSAAPRFFVGTPGGVVSAGMGSALPPNQWSHLAVVFDGSQTQFYLNGVPTAPQPLSASLTARGLPLRIGADANGDQILNATVDDVRIYARVLSQAEVQTDMNTPLGGASGSDSTPPSVALTFPPNNAQLSDIVTVTADATDNVGVAGVRFLVDGVAVGAEDTEAPYGLSWDTRTVANGVHTLTARARDAAGNVTLSSPVTVNVANTNFFQNEILATGFNLPTSIAFLPDGRLLVIELQGVVKVLPPPYTQASPTPFLVLGNVGSAGVQQGIYSLALDPDFANNRFYYLFYTAGTPNRDRLSRFTANASLTGTVAGSEVVLYQDPHDANEEHHGGAIVFGNDGKLYFTTGEHFNAPDAQLLSSPRGKIHRINKDGTVPTDNPFHDGAGPNWDSVWALGLRNPFRAHYDAPTGRLFVADVGSNVYSVATEEVNLGVAGANYGWPNSEGPCSAPCTSPIYSYHHNGRDASITGGFVYRGTQFPSVYQGNYFFADYTQNWIRRLTFDANGNVTGVFNFEPIDGSVDGPYGDIVALAQGPDGALYYVDLGYSDIGGTFGISKIRRIRYLQSNQAPVAVASASVTKGPAPLTVAFSSAGSLDPEGQPLAYSWTFGDNGTSTQPNPTHVYTQSGQYTARLSVSDGVTSTLAAPLAIAVGNVPSVSILSPPNDLRFRAGDVIAFSGAGTDTEDGTLPASAFTWNIDFLHEGHVHPGLPITGTKSGSFTIATTGHDFSGNTRYRITLTVTDSDGLSSQQSVLVYPDKVNLSLASVPNGLTLYLDGIARVAPFVYDTLIGFIHTIEGPEQTSNGTPYTFVSWSDGGPQQHQIVVQAGGQAYTATYTASALPLPAGLAAAWSFSEGTGTSASDASGHGNTATLVNGVTWAAGRYGAGLSFNGANGYLAVANSSSLDIAGSQLTLTMWISPAALAGGDSVVLGKFWSAAMTWPYYQYGLELAGGRQPVFYLGAPSGVQAAYMGSDLPLGPWSHLAVVFNGSQAQFYVNGGLVSTQPLGGSIQAVGNALKIGADASPAQFYQGFLDEVRIYNRALTPAEVQTDMSTALVGGP